MADSCILLHSGPPYWEMIWAASFGLTLLILTGYCSFFS